MNKIILSGIDLKAVEHPDDKSLRGTLDNIPKFKSFMMNSVCTLREKCVAVEYAGNGIHVSETCLPLLHEILVDVCRTLDINKIPDFSLMWLYEITAGTEGALNPHITAMSGAVDLLEKDELAFLLGHEIGHQACGHKPYHVFLESLYMPVVSWIPGGKIWITLVRSKLLKWYRFSDFTADRVGLLACQDINVALTTMVKMSGIPKKYFSKINVDSFIKQAVEFDSMFKGGVGSLINYLSINSAFSPWLVLRAANLLNWYESGEYNIIMNSYKQ